MNLSDIMTREKVRTKKGEPARFMAALKGHGKSVLFSVTGETQEAAAATLLDAIRERFRGSYTPLCLHFRGNTVLIWRDGSDWVYGHLRDRPEPVGIALSADWKSRGDVERAARRHLAESGWDEQEETSEIIVYPDDQTWFGNWAREQKVFLARYRLLLRGGWTQQEASHILGGGQADPERIQVLGDPRQLLREMEALPHGTAGTDSVERSEL